MHAIRSKARHTAWKADNQTKYNPFARTRSNTSRSPPVARGLTNDDNHSETCVQPQSETDRTDKRDMQFSGPQHSATTPAVSPTTAVGESSNHNSDHSKTSTGTNGTLVDGSNGSGTRRRKWIPFGKKDKSQYDLERSPTTESEKQRRKKLTVASQLRAVLFGSWINVLLIMVPVGFAANYAHLPVGAVFTINFIAIIPLAAILSYSTEEIAFRVGEVLGGLLNASFGNAVELIVSIQALIKGEILIVKTSLIGSMLSNLLLVLGMAFFCGGLQRIEQFFNVTVAQTAASLLALSIGSLIVPTVFRDWTTTSSQTDLQNKTEDLSRGTSIILLFVYGSYLFFQLKSHKTMYTAPSQKVEKRKSSKDIEGGSAIRKLAQGGAVSAASTGGQINAQNLVTEKHEEQEEEEEDEEEPQLTPLAAVITLGISTTLVAFCSEFLVSSIDSIPISKTFIGLILLPIVGNAAEHATAVTVAIKDKMDLSIGVAVGSSMQIALLVLPLIDILGWITESADCHGNNMSLSFDGFQIAVLFVAVLLVNYLIQDGKSHWLEGVLLMSMYIIIAVAAWFYPTSEDCPATS